MIAIVDSVGSYLGRKYLGLNRRIWWRIRSLSELPPVRWYGRYVNALVRRLDERNQNHSTFFLRNRPELELMCRLLERKPRRSSVAITVLACSKGAEVYSIAWAIRSARPDLKVTLNAVDIAPDIVEFARRGVYSLAGLVVDQPEHDKRSADDALNRTTHRDQGAMSMFIRMTEREIATMFDRVGDEARIKPELKADIAWRCGDAQDPALARVLGFQDIVVANRFLCHMKPAAAERCLRSIARLVGPGGHLFVSGIDLDVRTKVAQDLGWNPVTDMIRQVHEGDSSLRDGWPLGYWSLEPFQPSRSDSMIRYASVFQLGERANDVRTTSSTDRELAS